MTKRGCVVGVLVGLLAMGWLVVGLAVWRFNYVHFTVPLREARVKYRHLTAEADHEALLASCRAMMSRVESTGGPIPWCQATSEQFMAIAPAAIKDLRPEYGEVSTNRLYLRLAQYPRFDLIAYRVDGEDLREEAGLRKLTDGLWLYCDGPLGQEVAREEEAGSR